MCAHRARLRFCRKGLRATRGDLLEPAQPRLRPGVVRAVIDAATARAIRQPQASTRSIERQAHLIKRLPGGAVNALHLLCPLLDARKSTASVR